MENLWAVNYQYSPLTPQQLRLLKPVYSPNSNDLRFEINHVSRKSAQRYTALSYTWGDQQPTKTIRLNGKLFHVRPNLLSCLYYLSRARREAELRWDWIWVDAICINQQDDREKSAQVGLMDRTYSDAQVVSLWLGLAPIPPYLQDLFPSQEEFSNDHVSTFEVDSFDWHDHLDDLLNRPYWSRFWVIQEFLRAREIHYYCSDHITNSERLYEMLAFETGTFGTSAATNDAFNQVLETNAKRYKAASLILARNVDMFPEQGSSLYDLLLRHGRAQCKDRRDRVFALLSLLGAEEHRLLSRLLPNYALDDDQVIVIALAHMINQNVDHAEISIDSDDIFQALGLYGGRIVRKYMLARARQFDYYDDWTSLDVARTMNVREDLVSQYGTFNDDTDYLLDIGQVSRNFVGSTDGRLPKSLVCKSLGVISLLTIIGALVVRYLSPQWM